MQLHQLRLKTKKRGRKRIGRGGKRGSYSGHGIKGQKSRAGARIRPGFRGGDNPIWKLFPKQRGATKRVDVKHAIFRPKNTKPAIVNLEKIDATFSEGDKITARSLIKKNLIKTQKNGIKILATGQLTKKLEFSNLKLSESTREKILKAGGAVK